MKRRSTQYRPSADTSFRDVSGRCCTARIPRCGAKTADTFWLCGVGSSSRGLRGFRSLVALTTRGGLRSLARVAS